MKYASYHTYKLSQIEWLPEVPSHWNVKGLRHVCRFAYGDSLAAENREDGDIAVYGSNGPVGLHDAANTLAPVIVVGRKGSFGKLNYSTVPVFAIDTTYFVDTRYTNERMDWLAYALQPLKLDQASKDSAVPGLAREDAYKHKLPVPPLEEQQTIARFLDAQTARIDTLVAKKRQLIAKLKEKRSALIARTVTRGLPPEAAKATGLAPNPEMKDSGVEWLAELPTHWQLISLKRIVEIPITDGPHETPEFVDDGIPFASAEAVQNGRVHLASVRGFITEEDHKRYAKKYLPARRDIYIVKSGSTTGKVAIVDFDDEFNVWSPLAAVRCDLTKAYPEFMFFALGSDYFQGLIQVSWSFGTQPNIGMGVIGDLSVVLPPVDEQIKIANFLATETSRLDQLVEKAECVITRLTEYRQALITSAVTGKIDVREAAA